MGIEFCSSSHYKNIIDTGGGYSLLSTLSFKRVLLLCLLLLASISCLFATENTKNIVWPWHTEDKNVKYFRWQLNGEDEDKWQVVEASTTSITIPLESSSYTLYVQASYDGINWSKSAKETYVEPSVETSVASDGVGVVGSVVEPVQDTSSKAEATKKDSKSQPKTKTIKPVDYSAKKYEVSLILSPYSNEHIKYTGNHKPQSLSSFYGFGAGLGFNYNIEENYGIGSRFFYQWHEFKDFHTYNEFKLDVSVRYKVFTSQNLRFKLYLSHSIGADFVLRDDEDKCIYALFGIIGIQEDVMLSNEVSLNWGTDVSFTFQNGSSVLHFTPYLGVTYHWGKDA